MKLIDLFQYIPSKLSRKYEKFILRQMNKRIPSYLGLTPNTEFMEDDVFVVGYPKSGNTWLQNIISGIVFGVDPEITPDALIQEIVPDLHRQKFYKRTQSLMFFKSHHLPRPEHKKVIYIMRDGRDVMVSYYHYNKAIYGENVNMEAMIMDNQYVFPCKWHEHVDAWKSNPHGAQMIIVKYEDLLQNPFPELLKICQFTGLQRDKGSLLKIYDKCSFSKLQKKESISGLDDPTWPKERMFFRRGKKNSYKDEMPLESLRKFMCIAGKTLKQCGYD